MTRFFSSPPSHSHTSSFCPAHPLTLSPSFVSSPLPFFPLLFSFPFPTSSPSFYITSPTLPLSLLPYLPPSLFLTLIYHLMPTLLSSSSSSTLPLSLSPSSLPPSLYPSSLPPSLPLSLPPPSLPPSLLQRSGFTVVAEKLNFYRYLSHFRAVHRGAFFAEMRTTTVRKLLPEAWGM